MRKVILTSDYKGHKVGETIELDNDEASLAVNTGFGKLTEETVKAEAEIAKKQAEQPIPAYKPPDVSVAAAKKAEEAKKTEEAKKAEHDKAEAARKAEAAKRSGR